MLNCQLFCTFSLLYVLFLWIIYAMLFGYSLMGTTYQNSRNTLVIPSLCLRSSSVPKSVQSRCKVGDNTIRNRRFIEFGAEEERTYIEGTWGKHTNRSFLPKKHFLLFLGIFLYLQGGILIFFSYLCKQ